jgi:anaphase-promoting complex subunit 2
MKFQEKDTWSLQELSQSMKMCSFALKKKISFWKVQGLIVQLEQNQQKEACTSTAANNEQQQQHDQEIYSLVKDTGRLNKTKQVFEEDEDAEKSAQSNEILKEQDIALYWNYIQSMLRGCGVLPLDKILTWLKLYANPDLTIEKVKYLVELKTREQLLKYNAGLYRLNR